jgi:hypothetical protein
MFSGAEILSCLHGQDFGSDDAFQKLIFLGERELTSGSARDVSGLSILHGVGVRMEDWIG